MTRNARVFDTETGLGLTSQEHVQAEIPGILRVIVDESADADEVVTGLLRIAELIHEEQRRASHPNNNPLDEDTDT